MGIHLAWDEEAREFWVSKVETESPAEQAGVRIRDVILKEGGIPMNSWTNYYRALARDQDQVKIKFEIERNGKILSLAV